MSRQKRVLLLGTTGVSKQRAFDALCRYRKSGAEDVSSLVYMDFERDYLKPLFNNQMPEFLDASEPLQQMRWKEGWAKLLGDCQDSHQAIFLGLHGVLVREVYGVRALAYIDRIREFAPTHIITLIDDVYIEHATTEKRAQGLEHIGRPRLSQLIDGRRAELLVGDLIRRNVEAGAPLTNWLLAVRHPARLLDRIVFGTEHLIPVYLSFPITGPRKLLRAKSGKGVEQVDNFLRQVTEKERAQRSLACFCPLSIDELPLLGSWDPNQEDEKCVEFNMSSRWNVKSFWNDDILLTDDPPASVSLENGQIDEVRGMIKADVAVRDYRLVMQAARLLVFNPIFEDASSGGVWNEIQCAVGAKRPVFIYQDPAHDRGGSLKGSLGLDRASALGRAPGTGYLNLYNDLDQAMRAAFKSEQ